MRTAFRPFAPRSSAHSDRRIGRSRPVVSSHKGYYLLTLSEDWVSVKTAVRQRVGSRNLARAVGRLHNLDTLLKIATSLGRAADRRAGHFHRRRRAAGPGVTAGEFAEPSDFQLAISATMAGGAAMPPESAGFSLHSARWSANPHRAKTSPAVSKNEGAPGSLSLVWCQSELTW